MLRHLLIAIVALGLVATLVFFYNKTEGIDLSERNDINELLRGLSEIDSHLDIDILRARMDPAENPLPALDRSAAAQRALKSLATAVSTTNSPSLRSANFAEISKAITDKVELVKQYRATNSLNKKALNIALAIAAEPTTNTGPHKTDGQLKEFHQVLNQLANAAVQYYWYMEDAQRNLLETETAHMLALEASLNDAEVHNQSLQMDDAIQALLNDKPVEQELFSKVSQLTSGPSLQGLTLSFNRELEVTLQDKERFRVYMIAYAAALLVGIGYLGVRLEAAKESLEHRVVERTRELSEALQHLKESEAQLIQSEKMSSVWVMVAGVAHEINTPLAYVSNSINSMHSRLPEIAAMIDGSEKLMVLLKDQHVDPDELNRQFALLSGQIGQFKEHEVLNELAGLVKDGIYGADQVKEIVSNLKDFSRLDRSKVSSFNLNDGLNSTLGLARHLLKTIKINKNFGDIPPITCAPSQINQVFLNLITNAAQALPPQNGEITLTTRRFNNGVAVEIADNGTGIPPEVLPKIFDPFFTTKEIGKGTGLGLSISYKIVQDHGGRIDVESQTGKGTKFTVWLPQQGSAESRPTA